MYIYVKLSCEIGNYSNGITPINTWMNASMRFLLFICFSFSCVSLCLYVSVAFFSGVSFVIPIWHRLHVSYYANYRRLFTLFFLLDILVSVFALVMNRIALCFFFLFVFCFFFSMYFFPALSKQVFDFILVSAERLVENLVEMKR